MFAYSTVLLTPVIMSHDYWTSPASLIATPGVQSAGPVSYPVSAAISARNQRADDSDEEAVKGVFGGISDQEIGGTSEIEESPFVLPQEHLAAESSVRQASSLCRRN